MKKKPTKANASDLTLRNIRQANRRLTALEARVKKLEDQPPIDPPNLIVDEPFDDPRDPRR